MDGMRWFMLAVVVVVVIVAAAVGCVVGGCFEGEQVVTVHPATWTATATDTVAPSATVEPTATDLATVPAVAGTDTATVAPSATVRPATRTARPTWTSTVAPSATVEEPEALPVTGGDGRAWVARLAMFVLGMLVGLVIAWVGILVSWSETR